VPCLRIEWLPRRDDLFRGAICRALRKNSPARRLACTAVIDLTSHERGHRGRGEHGDAQDIYWTVGPYDIVTIAEFPDDATGTAFLLALGSERNPDDDAARLQPRRGGGRDSPEDALIASDSTGEVGRAITLSR
jgi:GYD domain